MSSADVDLFVSHAAWLAPHLPDSTRIGVLTWFAERLKPGVRERFLARFPTNHPCQVMAESAVCDLLAGDLRMRRPKQRIVETIDRGVDWAETCARAEFRPAVQYVSRSSSNADVHDLIAALVNLAGCWRRLLESGNPMAPGLTVAAPGLVERCARLKNAQEPHARRRLPTRGLSAHHLERIRRRRPHGPALAAVIEEALVFWYRPFGGKENADAKAFAAMADMLHDADIRNQDTLLEFTSVLSIVRAAVGAKKEDWPGTQPWKLLPMGAPDGGKYASLTLRSGDLCCRISKGVPRSATNERIADRLIPWVNEVLPSRGSHSRASGNQPDMVLTFWLACRPERWKCVLADAKRNATGTGEDYLREAVDMAAVYLMSYGHVMGLRSQSAHCAL